MVSLPPRGRGEEVTPVPSKLVAHCVICCPRRALSTAEVYRSLRRLGLTSGGRSASLILDSLAQGTFASACANVFNRLEEAAVVLAPEVGRPRQALAQAASRAAFVSGSGSAVYALLDSAERAAEVARAVERAHPRDAGRVIVARTEPQLAA